MNKTNKTISKSNLKQNQFSKQTKTKTNLNEKPNQTNINSLSKKKSKSQYMGSNTVLIVTNFYIGMEMLL